MDFRQLIQELGLDKFGLSLPAAIDDGGIRRHAESGDPQSKSLAEGMVIRTTISNASSCVALWQQAGEGVSGSQNRPIHPTQRQFTSWALWAADAAVNALLGLRRSRQ